MINRAFLLSSGLGTRLRPLTEQIPKPLVPIFHKPLLTFALDHLFALGMDQIGINVRYLWESFYQEFRVAPDAHDHDCGTYEGQHLHFFKEPSYLDTGGSLRNARHFLEQGTFLIHNGDILTNIPLEDLLRQHHDSGAIVTLLLREHGGPLNVCYDETSNRVIDIRGNFSAPQHPLFLYCGIAVVDPTIFNFIAPEGPVSLIDALLHAMNAGHRVGGFVSRSGFWSDIGTPESYLQTHCEIAKATWKFYYPLRGPAANTWPQTIDLTATMAPSSQLARLFHTDLMQKQGIMMNTVLEAHVDLESRESYNPESKYSSALSHRALPLPRHDEHEISGLDGSVVAGPGASMAHNANVTDSMLLPGVNVPATTENSRSLILPPSVLPLASSLF